MPRYLDKMRLTVYLAQHGTITALIEFLILNSYPDNIIQKVEKDGIEFFVAAWEEAVSWIPDDDVFEEYQKDLWTRNRLGMILEHASESEREKYMERIQVADDLFKNGTQVLS